MIKNLDYNTLDLKTLNPRLANDLQNLSEEEQKAFWAEIEGNAALRAILRRTNPMTIALDANLREPKDSHEDIIKKQNELVRQYNAKQKEENEQFADKFNALFEVHRQIAARTIAPLLKEHQKQIMALLNPPKVSFWAKLKKFLRFS